jgi:hypothetical protein
MYIFWKESERKTIGENDREAKVTLFGLAVHNSRHSHWAASEQISSLDVRRAVAIHTTVNLENERRGNLKAILISTI